MKIWTEEKLIEERLRYSKRANQRCGADNGKSRLHIV